MLQTEATLILQFDIVKLSSNLENSFQVSEVLPTLLQICHTKQWLYDKHGQ